MLLVAGLCFLVSYGIHKGWITPTMRILGAAILSIALGVGGDVLRRRGDTGAGPEAMAAVSVAGSFATLTAACHLYDMVGSPVIALGLASLVAAGGVYFAVNWNAQLLGALALLGALSAPLMVDVPLDGDVFWFSIIAYGATMVICAARGWRHVLSAAVLLEIPIAIDCLEHLGTATVAVGWSLVWLATQIGAISYDRAQIDENSVPPGGAGAATPPIASAKPAIRKQLGLTLIVATTGVALAGFNQLAETNQTIADGWFAGLGIAHIALALVGRRQSAPYARVPLVDWFLAISLLAIAAGEIFDGPALIVAWCTEAAVIAWFTRSATDGHTRRLLRIAAGALLVNSVIRALNFEAPTSLLELRFSALESSQVRDAVIAIGAIVSASALWFWREVHAPRAARDICVFPFALAITGIAYLAAILLDGPVLVCALAVPSILLLANIPAVLDQWARAGTIALASFGAMHVLAHEAQPWDVLADGVPDLAVAALVLLVIAGACAIQSLNAERRVKTVAFSACAIVLVYLGSAAIIFAFPPSDAAAGSAFANELGSGQQGQALLSAFWALVAFGAVIVGLKTDIKELRIAGLSLLLLALGKILLFDLSNLNAAYRTISFIAVGGVLLAAAFAFQRLKRDDQAQTPNDRAEPPDQ